MNLGELIDIKQRLVDQKAGLSESSEAIQTNQKLIANLDKKINQINVKIELVEQLNNQFRSAFLKMLWDEIYFQFKCLADEESKKWQWSYPINIELRFYKAEIDRNLQDLPLFADKILASCLCLSTHNDRYELFYTRIKFYLNAVGYCLDAEVQSVLPIDPVAAIQHKQKEMPADQKDKYVKTLDHHYANLCEITALQEKTLTSNFTREEAVESKARDLRFHKVIPDYSAMNFQEKAKTEGLVLQARYPLLLNPGLLKAHPQEQDNLATSFSPNVKTTDIQNVPSSTTTRNVVQKQTSNLFVTTIKNIIKDLYRLQNADNLLEQLKSHGTTRWWFWPGEEYSTVKRLLDAALNLEQKIDSYVDAMRRIDRLQKIKLKQNPNDQVFVNDHIERLRDAFERDRCIAYRPMISENFIRTTESQQFEKDICERENKLRQQGEKLAEAYNIHLPRAQAQANVNGVIDRLDQEKKLPNQEHSPKDISIDIANLPDNIPDLNALIYFIAQHHLGDEISFEHDLFLPMRLESDQADKVTTLTLKMSASTGRYANFLTNLQGLSSSKSLYFSVLLISIMLFRTSRTESAYEVLYNLLVATFTDQYPTKIAQNKRQLRDAGLGWLADYLPNTIVIPSNIARIKEQCLKVYNAPVSRNSIVNSVSPDNTRKSSFVSPVPSVATSEQGSMRGSSFTPTKAQYLDESLKGKENDAFVYTSFSNADTVFVSTSFQYAKDIIGNIANSTEAETIKMKAEINFYRYKSAPLSVVLLYTLLEWYIERRKNTEDSVLIKFIKSCFALQYKIASYLEKFRKFSDKEEMFLRNPYSQDVVSVVALEEDITIDLSKEGCKMPTLFSPGNSAGKLTKKINDIFPDRKISYPLDNNTSVPTPILNSHASSSSSESSTLSLLYSESISKSTEENLSFSEQDADWLKQLVESVTAISSTSKKTHCATIKTMFLQNLQDYPGANRKTLVVYTLAEWFKTTLKENDNINTQYNEIFLRLEFALRGEEQLYPKADIARFMSRCCDINGELLNKIFAEITKFAEKTIPKSGLSISMSHSHTNSSINQSNLKVLNKVISEESDNNRNISLTKGNSASAIPVSTSLLTPQNSKTASSSIQVTRANSDMPLSSLFQTPKDRKIKYCPLSMIEEKEAVNTPAGISHTPSAMFTDSAQDGLTYIQRTGKLITQNIKMLMNDQNVSLQKIQKIQNQSEKILNSFENLQQDPEHQKAQVAYCTLCWYRENHPVKDSTTLSNIPGRMVNPAMADDKALELMQKELRKIIVGRISVINFSSLLERKSDNHEFIHLRNCIKELFKIDHTHASRL